MWVEDGLENQIILFIFQTTVGQLSDRIILSHLQLRFPLRYGMYIFLTFEICVLDYTPIRIVLSAQERST